LVYDVPMNAYACPGWSFYQHAADPRKDAGVQRNLSRSDAPYWAATEWLLQGTEDTAAWRQALANTLADPRCRYSASSTGRASAPASRSCTPSPNWSAPVPAAAIEPGCKNNKDHETSATRNRCLLGMAQPCRGQRRGGIGPRFSDPPARGSALGVLVLAGREYHQGRGHGGSRGHGAVGLGGALWMWGGGVGEGVKGPVKFLDAQWWELMRHTVQEADRLGVKINLTRAAVVATVAGRGSSRNTACAAWN